MVLRCFSFKQGIFKFVLKETQFHTSVSVQIPTGFGQLGANSSQVLSEFP